MALVLTKWYLGR